MKPKVPLKNLLVGNLLVVSSILILSFLFSDVFDLFELKTLDVRYRVREMTGYGPNIHKNLVNVNIDDYSRKESGKIIEWPKSYYSVLFNKLAAGKPKVIACDILFGHSNDTLGNGTLIESISNTGVTVSPFLYTDVQQNEALGGLNPDFMSNSGLEFMPDIPIELGLGEKSLLFAPLDQIVYESLATGFVNVERDPDGVVRRLPVIINLDGKLSLALFFQALCDFMEYDPENIKINSKQMVTLTDFPSKGGIDKADIRLPLDQNGFLPVNFAGPYNAVNYPQSYSAWDIMTSTDPLDLNGKYVVLSDVSVVESDYAITPLDKVFPKSYLYTNAVSSILNRDFLMQWSVQGYTMYLLGMILLLFFGGLYMAGNQYTISALLLIAFHTVFNFTGFIIWGHIYPLVPGLVLLASIFMFTMFYRFATVERDKGVLEGSLKSYLSPHLMSKIEENPDLLKLGGERKRITVIFADLANFTTFCDTADPAEIQEVLSTYFAEAAEVVFAEGGIVDKYLGDGILAFFENEGEAISSPMKATRASIALQKRSAKINKLHESQNRFPFIVRIGIATGYAKVGNIGPPEKIDYTIIGSVVNLASRLQGVGDDNDIVVDEDTQFFLKEEYEIESCGEQALKGFANPIAVYKVKYIQESI